MVIDKIVKNIVTRFPGAGTAQVQSGYIIQMAQQQGGPCGVQGGGWEQGRDKTGKE